MVGAGHVGREVAALAHRCGFHVTVVDRRAELSNREALPTADEVLCSPEPEAFARLDVTPATAAIIATTGHDLDFQVVRGALGTAAGFIGLVGSRRKLEALHEALEREGVPEEVRKRIVCPVGMQIGAETPAEIAVSIVGQLIQVRRDHAATGVGTAPGRRLIPADGALQAAPLP
jgi:xanthine dehydrogenase accessory factor